MKTLIILNPNAGGGKARAIYKRIETRVFEVFGDSNLAVTERPEEVAERIDVAAAAKISRLIAIGGDGTNHAVVNALAKRPELAMTLGSIPVGTGSDLARSLGTPSDPQAALDWLARAKEVNCDLGKVEFLDTKRSGQPSTRTFLNIASAGVSGDVDARVNRSRRRSRLTFLKATIATLLRFRPQRISVECDGKSFYHGSSYLLAVANGRYFGRGMMIAPHALINDGLLDVVLVEGMPRLRILIALQTVFSGRHLERSDVHHIRASKVFVHSENGPLGLDLDGEEAQGQDLTFTILPAAIRILLDPDSVAVKRNEPSPGL